MKVALLAGRHDIHTVRWANGLAGRGHEIHVLSCHGGGDPLAEGVASHRLPFPAPPGYVLNLLRLRRLLASIRPHLMNTHFAFGYGLLGRLSAFHPHLLSVWGSDVYELPQMNAVFRRMVRRNLEAADWVASTSHVMAAQARRLCPGLEHLSVTPFGIDLDLFSPRPAPAPDAELTIGIVKKLEHKYGVDVLIRAFARLRNELANEAPRQAAALRLLLVGEGADRAALAALARDLGVDAVTRFAGKVPHREVPEQMRSLDVYVATSRLESESFGVAVLEASACELPVVVSNIGGLPEVVADGETGLIVEPENVEATTAALRRLALDPELRRRLGRAGRRWVAERYSWQESLTIMEGVYERTIHRSRQRHGGSGQC